MVNKLLRIGDSVGVTIPKRTLQEMGVSIGDQVVITFNPDKNSLEIKPLKRHKKVVSDRMARLTTEFMDRYKPALKKMAGE